MANGLGDLAQRARRSVPGVQDAFGGSSMVLDSLYNRYVHPPLQGLADAAALTRDVAQGKASMNDPATQQRAIGAGVDVGLMGSGAPEGALGAGFQFRFPKGIIAYHGSPHTFERFDPTKIGTGEGAQAYGHGLYFAENEDVAKGYRDRLAPVGKTTDNQGHAERILQQFAGRGDRDAAINEVKSRIAYARSATPSGMTDDFINRMEHILSYLENPNWKPRTGSMYQVRLHADPEEFLSWDQPLTQQSPAIKEFMKSRGIPEMDEGGFQLSNKIGEPPTPIEPRPIQGDLAYHQLGRWWGDKYAMRDRLTGEPMYPPGTRPRSLPAAASRDLEQAGIPGIRYFDQGSRAGGEGTSNYVVFSPQIIDILKRYGLTGPGLAALAYMANQQRNAGPATQ